MSDFKNKCGNVLTGGAVGASAGGSIGAAIGALGAGDFCNRSEDRNSNRG